MKFRQRKKNVRKFLFLKQKSWIGKGVQYVYYFPNGNMVSVGKFEVREGKKRWGTLGADLGLYELADLREGDVLECLTEKDVVKYLERALKR